MLCAQLTVQNTLTPEDLVNDLLLGDGVEAENVSWNNGAANEVRVQFGSFAGGSPYIGLDHGIIMATGGITVAEGPNDIPTANVPVPLNQQLNEDPDLSQLIGGSVLRDVAIVEFDFVPRGDTLRFRYVFASEEYNDHTCSPYNDAFGFFVSGPGIVGNPNFANNARNVAVVPGTNVPVAINTVNLGIAGIYGANSVCNAASANWQANNIYFVNNANNSDPGTTQFDGYTVPMLIEIPVVCGETYHIKMAIADAVDDKNDSAVFIEAGSFDSEPLFEAALTVVDPVGGPDTALEGCSAYELHLVRFDSLEAKTVYLKAEDLEHSQNILPDLPAEVTFQPGEAEILLHIPAVHDGVYGGLRAWKLEVLIPHTCGLDTAVFALPALIDDRPLLEVTYPESVFIACHDTVDVSVELVGGNPPYTISWSHPEYSGFSASIFAEADQTITAWITDQCGIHDLAIDIAVTAETYDPLEISVTSAFEFDCLTAVQINPTVSGGIGEYTYRWLMDDSLLTDAAVLDMVIEREGVITFEVDDRCADLATRNVEAILSENPITVDIGENREASCQDELLFVPIVQGGYGSLSYTWRVNNQPLGTQAMFTHQPGQNSLVTLTVEDNCGQAETDTLFISLNDPHFRIALPADTVVCKGQRVVLKPDTEGAMGEVSFDWPATGGSLPTYVFLAQRDQAFSVVGTDGCGRTAESEVKVWISHVEADFAFDYDYPDRPLRNYSTLGVQYFWVFPDGSTSDDFEPVFSPMEGEVDQVLLYVTNEHGCEASAIEFYDPPIHLYIPTAFTPDGDGLNDVFRAVGHNIAEFHLIVFDRGGHVVFETRDIREGWGGEGARDTKHIAGDSMFPYRYKATSWSGQIHEGHGVVTLLR